MATTDTFAIPPAYAAELRYAESVDTRSDAEILAMISKHTPVVSEKNIWAYWDAGLKAMPAWCQRNVVAWQRICGPSWTIRVLDDVPDSPNYALRYVSKDLVPACFVNRTMEGPYTGAHSSDFVRTASLLTYGGVYMDVGNILFRSLDRVCWDQLADPESPYQISIAWLYGITNVNHFIAARKGDPFTKRWHTIFMKLWEGKNSHIGINASPLLAFSPQTFDDELASKYKWDFNVDASVVYEYVAQSRSFTRLCMLDKEPDNDGQTGFNPSEYWKHNVLLSDALTEHWAAEETIGFEDAGQKMFDLFSIKREPRSDSKEYQQAEKLVWRLLTRSSIQKITHGKGLTKSVHLGVLWDKPENRDKDIEPGTFAELLRYGAVNYVQTRSAPPIIEPPTPKRLLQKGYLEP